MQIAETSNDKNNKSKTRRTARCIITTALTCLRNSFFALNIFRSACALQWAWIVVAALYSSLLIKSGILPENKNN